ncbi:hypothetical protein [Ferruginibacter sp. HRS2-29]|uniref:hypothetical protein n=1 Tax=Ferruginibacter sp. HRS2-29 TaxID=2487334 RepID=UPI0020CEB93F|nr:hypothetical protein [Ferruginibacter sp. HRS2-29]MCP9752712.1 hypothetical protein [Ferruginibacter sp. HRS2-29]
MKLSFLLLCILYNIPAFSQADCSIGFGAHPNEISYNSTAVDSILHLATYDAFFLGESHTSQFEPAFKYNFIRQLNSSYGVKDVFMEIGYSAAYFFNLFLKTGDSTILTENHFPYLGGEYKYFWTQLYAYNKLLPQNSKIIIHGIDFERAEIFTLLDKTRDSAMHVPEELKPVFENIHALSKRKLLFTDKEFDKQVNDLKTVFFKTEAAFRKLYKDNFAVVRDALINKAPSTTAVEPRNKAWLENINKILAQDNIKKFIGFFGSAHTRYNSRSSLTAALNNPVFFSGKILNIATIYSHFKSAGASGQVIEYGYKEKEVFEKYYNKDCRAILIRSTEVPKTNFKTESDFILFAKEIVDE